MAEKQKVLLFWCEDKQWSLANVTAVKSETLGVRTQGKFQGKWYPAIIVAKDYPEALKLKEEAFKVFLNSCLQEEAPEDVENKVLNYIKDTNEMLPLAGTDAVEPLPKRVKLSMHASIENTHLIQSSGGNDVKPPAEKSLPLQKPVESTHQIQSSVGKEEVKHAAEESMPLQKPVEKKPDILEKQGTESARNSENLQRTVDELQSTVKRLKERVKKIEKWQMTFTDKTTSFIKQESSTGSSSNVSPTTPESPHQPSSTDYSLYNGKTYQMLQDSVNFTDDLYSTVMTLLTLLFSDDYIISHSVTGQRGNSALAPKPKFDSRLFNAMVSIIRSKFPSVSKSDITLKVQSVQKKIKRKN